MSLKTPTVNEISENIVAQLESSLNQKVPELPRSFIRVLAKSLAAVFVLLYKYAGFSLLQSFVKTATIEPTEINGSLISPLVEWGRLIGIGDPTPATQAELKIEISVTNQSNDALPSGTQLVSSKNGVIYITNTSVFLNSSSVTVDVVAASDQSQTGGSGTQGNLQIGDVVSFANPLPAVQQDAKVIEQIVTAADAEEAEVYRIRIVDRFQKLPQGGAYADYELWGEAVAGITNVYPYTSARPGEVDLYVESSTETDGIPTSAQLLDVWRAVEVKRPAGARVRARPITRREFIVTVNGLDVPDQLATRDLITSAVDDYFRSREPFIAGLTIPPRRDRITQSGVAGAVEDIAAANGGVFASLFITHVDSSIAVPIYELQIGEKSKATVVFK